MRIETTGIEDVRATMQRIGTTLSAKALATTAIEVEDYIIKEAGKHEKQGTLNRSIDKKLLSDGGWLIGHDEQIAPHAVFFMTGTGLHGPKHAKFAIFPKNKKALRWVSPNSKFAFAKHVMNPGMKQDNWISRAATLAPQVFAQHISAALANLQQGQT